MTDPNVLIDAAASHSRYLARLLAADPALRETLIAGIDRPFTAVEIKEDLAGRPETEDALRQVLRKLRRHVMARLIVRDLGGLADLAEVTATMTALADQVVIFAANWFEEVLSAQFGVPRSAEGDAQELIVIGMGKLGGGELNVSSDIDLIFAYGEDGETDGERSLSNFEYFSRLAKRLIPALSDVTADGFVFRVDMRLRPYGDSGAIVSSFAALENYYQTQGREWERYALIKARIVRGAGGETLMQMLTPFVYRKYLDYGAISSMRALHEQISQEVRRRDRADNIKTGPGGIREIEFAAQLFQLIRGGREPDLRIRPTLEVLARLSRNGQMLPQTVQELSQAYGFLRRLEHRIQYIEDAQTHSLPADAGDRQHIAASMGFATVDAFLAALEAHRQRVNSHFRALFAGGDEARSSHPLSFLWLPDPDPDEAQAALEALGVADPAAVLARLTALHHSNRYQYLSASQKGRVDSLIPRILQSVSGLPRAADALVRMLDLIETMFGREAYLAMLQEYPVITRRVARVCAASPWASHYMARHPMVLDQLLTARHREVPDWQAQAAWLAHQLQDDTLDIEARMDVLRQFKNARLFDLLVLDLEGHLPLEVLADHLSALADLILQQVLQQCWLQLRQSDQPRFAIIAYGKLGGKELGYASDLDLIFLYDDDRPDAQEIYARLAQRINAWLSSYTSAGLLYETDLRLRPNGAAGLLVSSVAAFEQYQTREAWVWEHQALTRARFVAGDMAIGQAFEAIRNQVLCLTRDRDALAREIVSMRQRMLEGHPNPSALFDLKHDRGGMVDIEFTVQYLVLAYAARFPALTANVGNLKLLQVAAGLGLIRRDLARAAQAAYRRYRLWQHHERLQEARYARVPPEAASVHVARVKSLWDSVFGTLPAAGEPHQLE